MLKDTHEHDALLNYLIRIEYVRYAHKYLNKYFFDTHHHNLSIVCIAFNDKLFVLLIFNLKRLNHNHKKA